MREPERHKFQTEMKKNIITLFMAAAMSLAASYAVSAQSQSFKLGQWAEIHNAVLKELNRSYVDSLPIDRIMRASVDAMLEELDPYTIYIPEEENEDLQMMLSKTYGGIGAIIHKKKEDNVIINEPYAGSPAEKYGLQCGDEIIAIDGKPTKGLESKESSDRMKGKPGTTVTFTVKKVRTGDTLDIPIIRERIHFPDIEYAGMLDDTTGYILQTGFTENVSGELRTKFQELKKQGMKRLVLDLRGNGGGLMSEAINIVSLFVPKGSLVVSAKGNSEESKRDSHTTLEPIDTEIPIVVMINSGSASSAQRGRRVRGVRRSWRRAESILSRSSMLFSTRPRMRFRDCAVSRISRQPSSDSFSALSGLSPNCSAPALNFSSCLVSR